MNLIKNLSTNLTISDWFCGAGGSSNGAVDAGFEVVAAANHWPLAIDTHNTNHPDTDHYLTNLSQANPKYFPYTTGLWASPECTKHKPTKGRKRKNAAQLSMFDPTKTDPAEDRSRATAWCIVRFAEYHDYEFVIVENIVEFRYWRLWHDWLRAMGTLGYDYQICYFNSMFFNPVNGMSNFVPQSRDRMYIVFWKKGNKIPLLNFRPKAWCETCRVDVQAVQSWKNPKKKWGRYNKQYQYHCPTCAQIVEPYYYAAWNVIDWSIDTPKIGDRTRPLKPKTLERIRIGLEKYGRQPMLVQLAYSQCTHPHNRVTPLTEPVPTQTTRQTMAFVVSVRGTIHAHSSLSLSDPLPAQTTTNSPFLVELRKNATAKSINDPLGTVTAGGRHHGLIVPPAFIATYNGNPTIWPISDATPTVTTIARLSLNIPGETPEIDDCGFRMFEPHEIKRAMGFRSDYILLGNKRDQVKLSGNAVTPPVAEYLFRQCGATL